MAPGDPLTQRRLAREQIMFETRNAAEEKRRVSVIANPPQPPTSSLADTERRNRKPADLRRREPAGTGIFGSRLKAEMRRIRQRRQRH